MKFFIVLLIIALIGSAFYIYSAMKTAKAYSFFKPLDVLRTLEDLPSVKAAVDYGKKSIDKTGEKIKNQFVKVENSVSEATDKAKDSSFGFVKENLNDGLNAIGGFIGVDEKIINQNQEINQKANQETNNNKNCNN